MPRQDTSRRLHRPASAVALLAALALITLAGCNKPLLSPTRDRSQYDRYDRVRGQFVPQYIEDEYGRRTPNLRGRLGDRG